MLHVPVLLFWFAPRAPDEAIDAAAVGPAALLGRFPQLVDGVALAAVREACEGYAECRSERNAGHPLVSRFTGEPVELDYARLHGLGRSAARRAGKEGVSTCRSWWSACH